MYRAAPFTYTACLHKTERWYLKRRYKVAAKILCPSEIKGSKPPRDTEFCPECRKFFSQKAEKLGVSTKNPQFLKNYLDIRRANQWISPTPPELFPCNLLFDSVPSIRDKGKTKMKEVPAAASWPKSKGEWSKNISRITDPSSSTSHMPPCMYSNQEFQEKKKTRRWEEHSRSKLDKELPPLPPYSCAWDYDGEVPDPLSDLKKRGFLDQDYEHGDPNPPHPPHAPVFFVPVDKPRTVLSDPKSYISNQRKETLRLLKGSPTRADKIASQYHLCGKMV